MLTISGLALAPGRRGVDVSLAAGAINVVLGRNLSGKSALCRLLAGLPGPACGDVVIDGVTMAARHGRARPVAMVYQAFVNYPHWNVARNIASPMIAAGRSLNDVAGDVRALARQVGIEHLLDRMPGELSGGQQQRLAIARALAKRPRVLVMDEPFANIDYKLRQQLSFELRTLVTATGACLVYATSDPVDAMALADELVLVHDRDVIQTGRAIDVYRRPVSRAAADLLSDPGVNEFADGCAVRPEHVAIHPVAGRAVAATIAAVETNGAGTFVHAVTSEDRHWVVRLRGMPDLRAGAELTLYVRDADVLTFAGAGNGRG